MGNTVEAFATPLYYNQVEQMERIQAEIAEFITAHPMLIGNPPQEWNETVNTSFSYAEDRSKTLLIYHMPTLANQIIVNTRCYLEKIGNKHPYIITIDDMWVNIYKKNDYMNTHDHKDADISGVYYYKTNTQDGDIVFSNPCDVMQYTKLLGDIEGSKLKVTPNEGKIILFPAWLKHSVNRNTTDDDRVSVTFNIKLAR